MSIGPHRSSYGFSTIPSTPNSLPRQHMMNTPAFQQVMTLVPLPNSSLNTQSSNHSSSSNSSNGVSTPRQTGAGGNAQTMYCDNCQTFRHISFFQDKTFKYSVCRLCDEREMQKRIVNKERYEQYEEQQKNLKQSRYPIPQSSYSQATTSSFTSQAPPIFATHLSTSSPPQTSSSAQLSIQLPQMPITLGGNNSANLPPPPNLATPTSSNSSSHPSPQMNASSNMILGMNMNSNKAHLFPTAATTTITTTTASTIATPTSTPTINNIRNNPMHQTIQSSLSVPNPLRMRSTNKTSSSQSVDLISLDEFVQELRKHVDFDRKLFHLNIQPLIEELGPSAGFSQIGRGICEKVLEGTRFNFR
ncbi:hypothetical protein G6F56_008840 [Rhizopus delemar]|nr:hypothetical protein G6F56_008840 [Rhizopus delemar]